MCDPAEIKITNPAEINMTNHAEIKMTNLAGPKVRGAEIKMAPEAGFVILISAGFVIFISAGFAHSVVIKSCCYNVLRFQPRSACRFVLKPFLFLFRCDDRWSACRQWSSGLVVLTC